MDAAGTARPAMTHRLGQMTAGGMVINAIQMLVHQGQWARYVCQEESPQRLRTHFR